jgi:hypothetical protein
MGIAAWLRGILWLVAMCGVGALVVAQSPAVTTGTIDASAPFAERVFAASGGETLIIEMTATSGDLDAYLYLVNASGEVIAENDDRERGNPNARIIYPQAAPGTYRIVATRYGGLQGATTGTFDLSLELRPPSAAGQNPYDVSAGALAALGFPTLEPRPLADWTILAYYGADTNLEQGLLKDMREFEAAGGSTQTVRIVVMLDRSYANFVTQPDWHSIRLFEATASVDGDPSTPQSVALADLGIAPVSSDGEVFSQFLAWGMATFPARRYALTFGSHGAAWEGLIQDDTPNPTDQALPDAPNAKQLLSLVDLRRALEVARSVAGVEKFDLLINDACLMSSVEYYGVMADFFHLSLASPEVVIDPALDMALLTRLLNDDPAADVTAVATTLVDTYIDVDIRRSASPDVANLNHAVADLDAFPQVITAVEEFARVFNRNPRANARALGAARHDDATYVYSGFLGSTTKVDLRTLMDSVARSTQNPELRSAALNVRDAVDRAVLYGRTGGSPAQQNIGYFNIYFPETSGFFRQLDYLEVTPLPEWGQMLRHYYNASNPNLAAITGQPTADLHGAFSPIVSITSVYPLAEPASVTNPVIVETEIIGRNIATVDSTIDQVQPDGTRIRLATERLLLDTVDETGAVTRRNIWEPGVNLRSNNWDVTLPLVYESDPAAGFYELLTFTETVAYLDGYYAEPGSTVYHDVTVLFSVVERFSVEEGRVLRVISRAPDSETAANIVIPEGSLFIPFHQRVSADGVTTLELSAARLTWPPGGLRYRWAPAPDGAYEIGILAMAQGGATGFDRQVVQVVNAGASLSERGETVPYAGFTLVRPADWERLLYDIDTLPPYDVEKYRISQPQTQNNYTVYILSPFDNDGQDIPGDDLPYIADLFQRASGAQIAAPPVPITVDDMPALEIAYGYEGLEGEVAGRGFILYEPVVGNALLFAAEVPASDDPQPLYQQLRAGLHLFPVAPILEQTNSQWLYSFNDLGSLALPPDWQETDYQRYTPDASPLTFVDWQSYGRDEVGLMEDILALYAPQIPGYTLQARSVYTGYYAWDVAEYTAQRGGQPVVGRIYAALVEDRFHVVQFEVPADASASAVIASTLEIIVDSVRPY